MVDLEPISLVTAIKEKYGCCDLQTGLIMPSTDDDFNNSLSVFMKIKCTGNLNQKRRELLVLNEQNIDRAGDLEVLSDLLRNVTDLDLSKNQFNSWLDLCQIFLRTPLLKHCDLSYNSSLNSSEFSSKFGLNFNKLQSLVLNATQISWSSIMSILYASPCLQELHLSFNDFGNVNNDVFYCRNDDEKPTTSSALDHSFSSIHVLYLNHCRISSWMALLQICRIFPCLEILVAPENPIEQIEPVVFRANDKTTAQQKDAQQEDVLPCLHSFNINRWSLHDWADIDRLRNLPLLSELRATGLPVLDSYEENERRMLIIARLPDLTLLNGSEISPTNREEAERFFIRYYLDATEKPDRYFDLVKCHGYLNKLLDLDLSPKKYANVQLIYEDENRIESRKINLNQTVAQFKKSLRNFCDLPPNRIRLWYLDIEAIDVFGMDELRYPGVMLHALRVADGDKFHIQAKPLQQSTRRSTNSGSSGCERLTSN